MVIEGTYFRTFKDLEKHRPQAVKSGDLNTLADGVSVRPSARRPPVRIISASKDGQVRCRAIPTQAKAALASCPAMIPSAYIDTSAMRLGEFLGGVRFP